ncbi:MAG: DUF29 family protein [Cyanobacteria bacterium P01_G01_bin.19]
MEQVSEMNLDYLLMLLKEIDRSSSIDREELKTNLKELVENILKLQYWEVEEGRNYQHWQSVVSISRSCIQKLLESHPYLQEYMEQIYPDLYRNVVNTWQVKFYIPNNIPIELTQILKQNYFG